MFSKCGCIVVGLLLCVSDAYGEIQKRRTPDFDKDYYFGGALRTNTKMEHEFCKNDIPAVICNMTCFGNHICMDAKCWCIQNSPTVEISNLRVNMELNSDGKINFSSLKDVKSEAPTRPALRHHIAHFCPNLDDARVCIRTCMKVGKPAFCGKDHQCYCGHKYTAPVKDQEMSAKEMYAQFKDLYAKYFGPGYTPVLDEDEN